MSQHLTALKQKYARRVREPKSTYLTTEYAGLSCKGL